MHSPRPHGAAGDALGLLSYNLHWTFGGRSLDDLERVLALAPERDVLCLQEVWLQHGTAPPDHVRLAGVEYQALFTSLSDLCRLRGFAVVPPAEADSTWGLMTLTRLEVRDHWTIPLGRAPGDPITRVAQVTRLRPSGSGEDVVVANMHPTHRVLHTPGQLRRLRRGLDQQGTPWLAAGDTNSFRWVRAACGLRTRGRRVGPTFPAARPLVQLDAVVGDPGWDVRSRRLRPGLDSDHLPVVAECRRIASADARPGTGVPAEPGRSRRGA